MKIEIQNRKCKLFKEFKIENQKRKWKSKFKIKIEIENQNPFSKLLVDVEGG
jgi:hypothetical protein